MKDINGQTSITRIPRTGMVSGVCAGVAERFALPLLLVRVLMVLFTIMAPLAAVLGYVFAVILLPVKRVRSWDENLR
jgi:phage shock protein C